MKFLGPVLALALASCLSPADPSTSESELAAAPQTGPTYHRDSIGECRELGLKFCSATSPAPQCPPNPQGQPCTLALPYCYKTLSFRNYEYYTCF
jgi:hypothetical protein